MKALVVDSVCKRFDREEVVKNISFSVDQGDFFALLGPNGAGKSTLINMICGAVKITSGQIEVLGRNVVSDFKYTRSKIGVMHQEPVIEQYFTIGKSLELHSGYYGVRDDPKWRHEIIERLQLRPYLEQRFLKLSGGTKRRFMLAKALLHRPEILILDEPTAGVDIEVREAIWQFVQDLNANGTTILLTTHYIEEAEKLCSRTAILKKGRLEKVELTANLIHDFGHQEILLTFDDLDSSMIEAFNDFEVLNYDQQSIRLLMRDDSEVATLFNSFKNLDCVPIAIESSKPDLENVFRRVIGVK